MIRLEKYKEKFRKDFISVVTNHSVMTYVDGVMSRPDAETLFDSFLIDEVNIWAVLSEENNSYIGHAGILKPDAAGDREIMFYLLPQFWGKGHGTTVGRLIVEFAINNPNIEKLIATFDLEHVASRKVCEKLGFVFIKKGRDDEGEYFIYAMETEASAVEGVKILSTERMSFRQFQLEDLDALCSLDSNVNVMRYISGGTPMKRDQVSDALKRIITRYSEWEHFGIWAVELKDTGSFVGWFAFKPLPKSDDIEVGYRLLPDYWGKGLATEGTLGLIKYGFEKVKLDKIVAVAKPQNKASRRVLEKCHFRNVGEIEDPFSSDKSAEKLSYYELVRSEYL